MQIWIDVAQLALIALGGAWALYNYSRFRRSQARVAIVASYRFHDSGESMVLLVKIRITNASSVLFRYDEAVATVMDAATMEGVLTLAPFASRQFLVPVYGSISSDPAAIRLGETFGLHPDEPISLEPGENVDSEAAFLVDAPLRMMAMRISVRGWQGRWGRRSYWWGAFFYIIPEGGGISPAVPGTLESMGES